MFGNAKAKEENRETAMREYMEQNTIEAMNPNDTKLAEDAILRLTNNAALSVGIAGKIEETTKISLLTAISEQNWIIINQLNRLNGNIEKLLSK